MACSAHTGIGIAHSQRRRVRTSKTEVEKNALAPKNGLTPRCMVAVPERRAEDVWMVLSLSMESALADGSDLMGIVDRLDQMF